MGTRETLFTDRLRYHSNRRWLELRELEGIQYNPSRSQLNFLIKNCKESFQGKKESYKYSHLRNLCRWRIVPVCTMCIRITYTGSGKIRTFVFYTTIEPLLSFSFFWQDGTSSVREDHRTLPTGLLFSRLLHPKTLEYEVT